MIKFFRKIRQKLLIENKFSKYLIYGIGEIILVVIGILIALQLNKNSDYKNDRVIELQLLENFTTDLQADISNLDLNISFNNQHISTLDSIIVGLNDPTNYSHMDFVRHNRTFGYYGNFEITDGTFVESTGAGRISLIQSHTIRKQLFNYYRRSMEGIDLVADQYMNTHINPNWFKALSATQGFAQAAGMPNAKLPPIDLVKVSKDLDFIGSINIKSGMCYGQIEQWVLRKKKINRLIEIIEKESERLQS